MLRRHQSSGFFGEVSEAERRDADLFWADLMGGAPSRSRRRGRLGAEWWGENSSGSSTPNYTPTDTATARAQLGQFLANTQGVWAVPSRAHAFFPHSSVALIHSEISDVETRHATGFVIAPDKIMTAARAITGQNTATNTIQPARSVRVTLGWDGVNNPPERPFSLTQSAVRWYPAPAGAAGHDVGVLILPHRLDTTKFPPFDLTYAHELPSRLMTIGYHQASGNNGFQRVHVGPVRKEPGYAGFLTRVFKSGGSNLFTGGPMIFVSPHSNAPNHAADWRVLGVIADVHTQMKGRTEVSEALNTWLTPAHIRWAQSVT